MHAVDKHRQVLLLSKDAQCFRNLLLALQIMNFATLPLNPNCEWHEGVRTTCLDTALPMTSKHFSDRYLICIMHRTSHTAYLQVLAACAYQSDKELT